ncbi:MAG: phage gp6-like head-tail connector protein [Bryobacterales bacterium]|nr:phage gp6-like head-tail connector protein [Bryobacterales bacterium]
MAETASQIVSLEQAKAQLEIPADDTDQDDQIGDLIAEVVSWIELKTGLPLLERTERYRIDTPEPQEAALAAIFNVTAIDGHVFERSPLGVRITPPAGGWQATSTVVEATREVGLVPLAVRRLALELLSRLYEGEPMGVSGGTRVMLEAIPREPARRLQPL